MGTAGRNAPDHLRHSRVCVSRSSLCRVHPSRVQAKVMSCGGEGDGCPQRRRRSLAWTARRTCIALPNCSGLLPYPQIRPTRLTPSSGTSPPHSTTWPTQRATSASCESFRTSRRTWVDTQWAGASKVADLRCVQTTGLKIEQVGDSLDHFVGSFPGPSGAWRDREDVPSWRQGTNSTGSQDHRMKADDSRWTSVRLVLLGPVPLESAELALMNRTSASVPIRAAEDEVPD